VYDQKQLQRNIFSASIRKEQSVSLWCASAQIFVKTIILIFSTLCLEGNITCETSRQISKKPHTAVSVTCTSCFVLDLLQIDQTLILCNKLRAHSQNSGLRMIKTQYESRGAWRHHFRCTANLPLPQDQNGRVSATHV